MKRFILQFRRTFVAIILALLMLAGMSGSLLGTALAYSSPNGAQDPYADTAGFLYYAGLKINGAVYAVWNDNTFVNEWSVPQYGEGETVTSVTADTNAGSVLESMGFAVADGQVMISPHEVSMPPGVSVYYESYDHAVIVTSAQQQQQQPTATITANPTFINQGSSTTIIWNSTNATSCTAITGAGFSGSEPTSGSSVVFPSFTQTYTITCSNNIGQSSQASVTITVNQQQQQQISATITANPSFINQGSSATLIWNSSNATSCIAISGSGFSGNEPTAGSQVVTPSTTQTYTVNCFNNTGQSVQASAIITVNQQQQQQPTVTITANPTFINQGSSTTLIWNTTNATSCTASGGSGFSGSESTSGSAVVSPSGTTTYSITCFNSTGQSATASVTVTVNQQQQQQPIVTISANPTVISQGSSTTIIWNSTNATSCTAITGAGFSGSEPTSGSAVVAPASTQSYTITCSNSTGQSAQASTIITVNQQQQQQPTVTITANPTFINQGSSTTLIWNTTNATSCTASGGSGFSGSESTSGSAVVSPSGTTTYSITCFNSTGQSATASVTVTVNQQQQQQPIVTISANPTVISQGSSSILTWNAVNATSCTATSGAGFSGGETTSGSQTVYPTSTQTYTLMCFNNSGQTGAASVTITVNQQQQQPTVTITANPTFINQGSSSTLIWNSANATYCTASNGWSGNESTSGSMTVTPSVTTTYTLNCFNGTGQSATASVTITVNQQQPTVTGGGVVAQPPVILCNDDNIPEGTEIMGPDGIKVYIVNAYCYKRHIFNPDIFNMYQNLSWNTIVHVNQPVLDSFKTSDLYQVSGTDFIYKVVEYPSGTAVKHLLEMTPDQLGDFGYDWRSIFIINQQEANYYPTGSPIVPTQQ